jgi:hypothetical protein
MFLVFYGPSKVHCRVDNKLLLHGIISHISPAQTPHNIPFRSFLILYIHLRLGLQSSLFLLRFPTKILYTFLSSNSTVNNKYSYFTRRSFLMNYVYCTPANTTVNQTVSRSIHASNSCQRKRCVIKSRVFLFHIKLQFSEFSERFVVIYEVSTGTK